ncbi:glycosyl transferase [Thermococcus chitonophagus]|uniref:Glycosyl transferase n=1 Tax=Thermococcus chitonophagus TaxID=54262 RepID=A0A170SE49_9EURY|nr:glycosyltransferase family 4 protein [Thermococcus chitonophagus]ASJ16056.1 glycosyl transferase [Thermococcus chitonophagus]CUX77304.1 glycosyltransferase (type 1) [Thermococcus chitonophagus]
MRILWLNWKDIKHPEAGGAEVYTHEIAKRLVKRGFEITLFTSHFEGAKEREEMDGIEIVRKGKIVGVFDTVYAHAKKFYRDHRNEFDLVIDEINTRPFMTPKYVDKPVVALIHQLAVEFWDYKTRFPVNVIGKYILEPYWLKHYRSIKTITVSESTKRDLMRLEFRDVHVVYNGLGKEVLDKVPKKEKEFTAIFVGRLTPTKKPEDAIKAFLEFGEGRLWIVGRGELMEKLKRQYNRENIEFKGFVTEREKLELMKRAYVILVPGIREGWGRVVIEANAMGTPAIGYNVPGLRDSIRHGYNGLLCEPNPKAMGEVLERLYSDGKLGRRLSGNALEWAKRFNWDDSSRQFEKILGGT